MPYDGIDFTAEVRPLYDADGNEIPAEIGRGVYRSDTGKVIATCGQNFRPVQHQDVIDPMLQTLKDQGYEIVERAASRHDLNDLAGQKGAFVHLATQGQGAIMRADIIVGDFVRPTGRTGYLDQGPDTMLRRFTALNSHNGSYAVKAVNGYFRLLCMNGMMDPTFTASSYGRHTTGFSIEALRRQITTAAELMENDAERFGLYARTPLRIEQAETFLRATLAQLPAKPNGEPAWSEPLVRDILQRFHGEDRTVWGLMNAMTAWATHGELRQNAGEITARTGRDDRVARTMRSREFEALLAA